MYISLLFIACNHNTHIVSDRLNSEKTKYTSKDSICLSVNNIKDTSIINTTNRTIDVLFNSMNNFLGTRRNFKSYFSTECMICESVQLYKNGFVFGKRLYVSKDSTILFAKNINVSDSLNIIKKIVYNSEGNNKKNQFSNGSLKMDYQNSSCMDADLVTINLTYDNGFININNILMPSFFEYDLDKDGINEQYILGVRNCTQELILLRINDNKY